MCILCASNIDHGIKIRFGKGPENKLLCYELEFGKYRVLYLSIKGGSSAKFGICWNKKYHAYYDKINQPIPELKTRSEFEKLKTDLIAILEVGIVKDFGNRIVHLAIQIHFLRVRY